jgi:hypothetical protein
LPVRREGDSSLSASTRAAVEISSIREPGQDDTAVEEEGPKTATTHQELVSLVGVKVIMLGTNRNTVAIGKRWNSLSAVSMECTRRAGAYPHTCRRWHASTCC